VTLQYRAASPISHYASGRLRFAIFIPKLLQLDSSCKITKKSWIKKLSIGREDYSTMGFFKRLFGIQDECAICHAKLDFQRKVSGMGALLDVGSLVSRVPYKCRACNTVVCYECASTGRSGCPRCGGKIFDQDSARMR
jgi:DNA-directed RNA polymerase subunit RPC12/RpoP